MTEQVNKRSTCAHCLYPSGQCVCHLVPRVDGKVTVWIVQDKHEAKHAKNTARLLALAYSNTRIVHFSDAEAMATLFRQAHFSDSFLLYPSNEATYLDTDGARATLSPIKHLILLDGTWPKAKKMWLLEAQLKRYRQVQFLTPPTSDYDIRKSPFPTALSTFEAAVYGLECLEALQMSKLRVFFRDAIALQWSKQPDAHKHRS